MKLLLVLGVLLFVPSALVFFVLVMRGAESHLVYISAASMYIGFGLTLYAIVTLWTDD
jgi:hypothetical protein